LEDHGYKCDFGKSRIELRKTGQLIEKIRWDDGRLPYVILQVVTGKSRTYLTAEEWHRRLGHIGKSTMENISRNNRAIDFHYKHGNFQCDTCMQAKSKRVVPQRKENSKSRKFGETLSIDIDELPVRTPEGYKYRLDVIDHATSWVWCTGIAKKNDFEKGLRWILNEVKDTVKEIRADGAREFHGQLIVKN
jgi:hypothetical protein